MDDVTNKKNKLGESRTNCVFKWNIMDTSLLRWKDAGKAVIDHAREVDYLAAELLFRELESESESESESDQVSKSNVK